MSDREPEHKTAQLEPGLRDMKIEEGASPARAAGGAALVKEEHATPTPPSALTVPPPASRAASATQSPLKRDPASAGSSPAVQEHEETVGGDITLKMEPGKAPKLSRTASQKVVSRPPPLYLDLPDATDDAKASFAVIPACTYANKSLGTTDHALECDCAEEWDPINRVNDACGEDSDCINRATKMECVGDCGCGSACQNQRFMQRQYADVSVIKTEKKGYGLRTNSNLKPGDFIFEYIGEVIEERAFRRRMVLYDQEGIKHFYFMSLTKGEFVDATKRGNLGRFCNHSCNPNCYVDKWVVGDKLRMGIFAERKIKAGEELVFNYNVDRYGADPQPCYCGEPNCTGFIGGKTQTDNATKLSHATIEALGIDDGDSWDTAVAKRPRKKKASEDDEEYVNELQPKSLEESGVNKVMAALRQCSEKWVAVKLLSRIQRSDDEKVGHRVIRVHGYEILKSTITNWIDDANVVLQVLDILHKLPRITRNKIQDSKIEETIESLKSFDDERVQLQASQLLEAWSKLEIAYRIPRVKRDPNATATSRDTHYDRREKTRERSRSRSKSPAISAPKGPSGAGVPSGPRGFSGRNPTFFNGARPPPRPRAHFNPLPAGWFQANSENGTVYYYNTSGATQWTRPTLAAGQPPPPPPKSKTNEQKLQDIISSITQNASTPTRLASASATPQPAEENKAEKKSKSEKWKSLPQEKQEKLYEATLHPHVMSVVSHYRKKLDKEDLKRLSKEVAKKLVRGDYKHGKVRDPTAKLDSKHEKSIKKFVKDFMDKAVQKKEARDKAKASKSEAPGTAAKTQEASPDVDKEADDDMLGLSDTELKSQSGSPDGSTPDLKRKRQGEDTPSSPKKFRTASDDAPPPPPPPPPPPAEDMVVDEGVTIDDAIKDESIALNGDAFAANAALPQNGLVMDRVKQQYDGTASPVQLATPPTTTNGSCEHDSNGKDADSATRPLEGHATAAAAVEGRR